MHGCFRWFPAGKAGAGAGAATAAASAGVGAGAGRRRQELAGGWGENNIRCAACICIGAFHVAECVCVKHCGSGVIVFSVGVVKVAYRIIFFFFVVIILLR